MISRSVHLFGAHGWFHEALDKSAAASRYSSSVEFSRSTGFWSPTY
jgi:hypothetical protein